MKLFDSQCIKYVIETWKELHSVCCSMPIRMPIYDDLVIFKTLEDELMNSYGIQA